VRGAASAAVPGGQAVSWRSGRTESDVERLGRSLAAPGQRRELAERPPRL